MTHGNILTRVKALLIIWVPLMPCGVDAAALPTKPVAEARSAGPSQKHWLFIWRDMKDP